MECESDSSLHQRKGAILTSVLNTNPDQDKAPNCDINDAAASSTNKTDQHQTNEENKNQSQYDLFPIKAPLLPKRPITIITKEYGLTGLDFPPTLAQFIDQLPITKQQRQVVFSNFKSGGVDSAWRFEDMRQRVLDKFPRAFAHDLTQAEINQVDWLFQLENDTDRCCSSLQSRIFLLSTIVFVIVLIVFWYNHFGINLFVYLHSTLLGIFNPYNSQLRDSNGAIIVQPALFDVLLRPADYSPLARSVEGSYDHHSSNHLSNPSSTIQFDSTEELDE